MDGARSCRRLRTMAACGLASLFLSASLPARAQTPDTNAIRERHAEQLGWLMQSWSSLEMRVSTDITLPHSRPLAENQGDRMTDHYVETIDGKRYDEGFLYRLGVPMSRSINRFDGRKGSSVAYDRKDTSRPTQAYVKDHHDLLRPIPLYHFWVGPSEVPLYEAIREATYQGEASLIGRDCDVFLVTGMGMTGQAEGTYSLDRTTSLPLRVVFYRNAADRAQGRVLFDYEVQELGKAQGYPYARRSVQEFPVETSGARARTMTYTVESLQFNKEYPLAFFQPPLAPGEVLHDTTTMQVVYSGPPLPAASGAPGKAAAPPASPPASGPPAPPPLRVERPRGASEIAAPVALGLGVLILSSSLVLLWKRRSAG